MAPLSGILLTLIAVLWNVVAFAQPTPATYPSKPVRIIVPFPPGGLTDNLTRALANDLTKLWGQSVIVDNRPGANTIIAAEATARAAPDGYTLLLASDSTLSINPSLYAKLPYDPVKDFVPIAIVAQTVEIIVANAALPASNVKELIALAKQKSGTINYASYGAGSTPHLATEMFKSSTGIDMTHIPFKGVADAMNAVLANDVQIIFASIATPLPHIRAGKLKALGIVSKQRSPLLPNVPTLAESGFADFDSKAWFGFVAPANTPPAIVDKLAADINQVVTQPAFREKYLAAVGLEAVVSSPETFAQFLTGDRAAYAKKVKIANVRLD